MTALALNAVFWIAARFGLRMSPFIAGMVATAVAVIAIGGAFTWWSIHQYNRGADAKEAEWQQKALQSKLDAARADIEIANHAAADATLRSAQLRLKAASEKEGTDAYIKWLEEQRKKAPGAPKCDCGLDSDDLRFMRQRRPSGGPITKSPADPQRPFTAR